MRTFSLAFALFFHLLHAHSQCNDLGSLQAIDQAGASESANTECTDANGWTHYYNSSTGHILLSIQKNGQDIGSLSQGLTVQAKAEAGYSQGAFNLSNADYIDNDIWTVVNRTWQVTGANDLSAPVGVRFYFSGTDVADIANTVDDFGFFVDQPEDIYMFTISGGGGLDAWSVETQPFNAAFTLYDMVPGAAPDWESGDFNGFPYGEFEVPTLDIAGGAGFLIFQSNDLLAISGKITRPNGNPVPAAQVQAASISSDVTNNNGEYTCATLLPGADYDVVPTKDINHAEGISMADLIAMSRHISGLETFSSPYQYIAADADKNAFLSFLDIAAVRDVLLGNSPDFPSNDSWRFVPKNYVFPDPSNPFLPPFPESIPVANLTDTLTNQDFTGIKIGDVADAAQVTPPSLNTSFSLQDLFACNPGDTVTYSLTVQDFQNIRGFQFSLDWNPAVMQFVGVSNFNLASFTMNSVGTANIADGKLSFGWFNPMNIGTTVANGTAICQIRFVSSGNIGDSSPLNFTGLPTELLLFHQNLSQVVPATTPGSLSISNNSSITGSAVLSPAGCNGQPVGAIDLTVLGGTPPLSYEWSNGASSEDLIDLPAGEYWVTVTDNSANCPLVFIFNLTPPPPMEVTGDLFNMSCPYMVDGSIELNVAGGLAPISYSWSNGSTASHLENLLEGSFSVTITDAAGCTTTQVFEIGNPNKIYPMVSVTNASYMTSANGAIMINAINGGTGPFTFLWNNGATTQSLMNILPGDYVVTITDGVGCHHVFGYEVYGLFTAVGDVDGPVADAAVFPNPTSAGGLYTLGLTMRKAGTVTASIVSPEGKTWDLFSFQAPAGPSLHELAVPDVAGLYFLNIMVDSQPAGWLKLVVQ